MRPKILVVDDEESLRLPLQVAFEGEGFDSSFAADGMEALDFLKAGDFQVMLTDLMMPKMNGIELMERAHALYPDLVVILMTGFGTVETAIQALKAGAYDYILKPFKLDEIVHAVRRASEQQRLQKENIQVNEINRRLTEIDEIKSNLLRAISHEFRTPLTVIYGWIDLLLSESSSGLAPLHLEGLKAIQDSSRRLGRMISNLLEFVALSKEQVRLKKEWVDLRPLLDEVLQQTEEEAKEKNLSVSQSLPSNLPPLWADPEKMKTLLFNLLENAIKFNEPDGSVTVEGGVTAGEQGLWLRIRNTRGEIPQDRLSELMMAFTQADMGVTRSASGLGLGLAVSKGIVDAHQGSFQIGSQPGLGTTVRIEFPLPRPESGP